MAAFAKNHNKIQSWENKLTFGGIKWLFLRRGCKHTSVIFFEFLFTYKIYNFFLHFSKRITMKCKFVVWWETFVLYCIHKKETAFFLHDYLLPSGSLLLSLDNKLAKAWASCSSIVPKSCGTGSGFGAAFAPTANRATTATIRTASCTNFIVGEFEGTSETCSGS